MDSAQSGALEESVPEGKVVVGQRLKSMKTRSVMVVSSGGGGGRMVAGEAGGGVVAIESEEEERRRRERRVSGILGLRWSGGWCLWWWVWERMGWG